MLFYVVESTCKLLTVTAETPRVGPFGRKKAGLDANKECCVGAAAAVRHPAATREHWPVTGQWAANEVIERNWECLTPTKYVHSYEQGQGR